MSKKWSKEETESLTKLYLQKGTKFCASHFQVSESQIRSKVVRLGLILTSETKASILTNCHIKSEEAYKVKADLFYKNFTPESVYVLGLLWADGHLSKRQVNISLQCVEKDGLIYKDIFSKTGVWNIYSLKRREEKWQDQLHFGTNNYHIHSFLKENDYIIKSNAQPTKVLSLIPDDLKHYFFRGYSDGDGCFYYHQKQGLYQFHFTSTFHQDWTFLESQMNELAIVKYKISQRVVPTGRRSNFTLSNKPNVIKWGEFIYNGYEKDLIGLPRKYEKFLFIKNSAKLRPLQVV